MKVPHLVTTAALLFLCSFCLCPGVQANKLLLSRHVETSDPESNLSDSFPFTPSTRKIALTITGTTFTGEAAFFIVDPQGSSVGDDVVISQSTAIEARLIELKHPGRTYEFHLVTDQARGSWNILISETPDSRTIKKLYFTGPLVIVISGLVILIWWWKSGVSPPWFILGAIIWFASNVLKIVAAMAFNPLIFSTLAESIPRPLFLLAAAIYLGLRTGLTEIGLLYWLAARFPAIARTPERAVAIGLAAGAVEAALAGCFLSLCSLVVFFKLEPSTQVLALCSYVTATTPFLWALIPAEQLISFSVHCASRVLALLAINIDDPRYLWRGIALISLADGAAGTILLASNSSDVNLWFVQATLLPLALLGIPLTYRAIGKWRSGDEKK